MLQIRTEYKLQRYADGENLGGLNFEFGMDAENKTFAGIKVSMEVGVVKEEKGNYGSIEKVQRYRLFSAELSNTLHNRQLKLFGRLDFAIYPDILVFLAGDNKNCMRRGYWYCSWTRPCSCFWSSSQLLGNMLLARRPLVKFVIGSRPKGLSFDQHSCEPCNKTSLHIIQLGHNLEADTDLVTCSSNHYYGYCDHYHLNDEQRYKKHQLVISTSEETTTTSFTTYDYYYRYHNASDGSFDMTANNTMVKMELEKITAGPHTPPYKDYNMKLMRKSRDEELFFVDGWFDFNKMVWKMFQEDRPGTIPFYIRYYHSVIYWITNILTTLNRNI